jgi:hypothetical protein
MKKRINEYFLELEILLLSHSGSRSGKNRGRKEANNTTTLRRGWPLAAAVTSVPRVLRDGEAADEERTQREDEHEDSTPRQQATDGRK